MMKSYIYIGSSIRGRDPVVAATSKVHITKICEIIERNGFGYFAEGMRDEKINVENQKLDIPRKYFANVTESVINSVIALRADGDREKLKSDFAMCEWTNDLLENSIGCVWYVGRSWLGGGIEVAQALAMKRQCLVLFSTPSITSLINGKKSRLLTVRRWDDATVESDINEFLEKIHGKLDHILRVSVDTVMRNHIEKSSALLSEDPNDYLRELIRQDMVRREGGINMDLTQKTTVK